jgi:AraC-like DNA-binding protein
MKLSFIKPSEPLQNIINSIMIFRCNLPDHRKPLHFPLPPLPEHHICFYGANPVYIQSQEEVSAVKLQPCAVVGPHARLNNIQLPPVSFLIKVNFQPAALFRILKFSLKELLSVPNYNGFDVLGNEASELNEQIANTADEKKIVKIVENYFLKKMRSAKEKLPVDYALCQLIKKGGTAGIDELANASCLSNRQFERLCIERTGYSPKFFSRLTRFANAWITKEKSPLKKWTDIAHSCGYFDQMHFIKDFKQFTGTTPTVIEKILLKMPFNPENELRY